MEFSIPFQIFKGYLFKTLQRVTKCNVFVQSEMDFFVKCTNYNEKFKENYASVTKCNTMSLFFVIFTEICQETTPVH